MIGNLEGFKLEKDAGQSFMGPASGDPGARIAPTEVKKRKKVKMPKELFQHAEHQQSFERLAGIDPRPDQRHPTPNLAEARMMLLRKADLKNLPPLRSQDGEQDPMVWVKFFNPYGVGTWLATEYDGKDTFFGAVTLGHGWELGYFSLRELKSLMKFGAPMIERDRYFKPQKLSQAKHA